MEFEFTDELFEKMSYAEKLFLVLLITLDKNTPEEWHRQLFKILYLDEREEAEKPTPFEMIDLETPGRVEEIVNRWRNEKINIEEFMSVLSTLMRYEDDDLCRTITDKMIKSLTKDSNSPKSSEGDSERMKDEG